jgi:AP-1 complex subunit beta-1
METPNLDLKKLVYLYIINYAKSQPDLAILGINTFRKDSRDPENPLLRALAVRTMGCIGVKAVTEYLCDPLKDALSDADAYVRKTAAICVAKLYEINPEIVEDFEFIYKLVNMISDGNAMVVANAILSINEISNSRGPIIQMDSDMLGKLLNALAECSEWSRVYILDCLAQNVPKHFRDIDSAIERVVPHLSHSNPAVVLSAVKVIVRYMDALTDPEKIRSLSRRITPPLVSLMTNEPEIQYIALRNINLIIQKRPNVLEKEIKIFFCNYNDPIYVKLAKLEVIIKLADIKNVDQILHELKEYAEEVDIIMVRKAIQAIGRCAIKLERAADRCVQTLVDLVGTRVSYIIEEIIIVVKDIFRKYPNKYESIIKLLCDNLKTLQDKNAKSAIVWIIGQYADRIQNSLGLLISFANKYFYS